MHMKKGFIAAVIAAGLMLAGEARAQPTGTGGTFGYARLGYGGVFGDRTYGGPDVGFGYRAELDTWGFDVSFLNLQLPSSDYDAVSRGMSGSFVKVQGLHFLSAEANTSIYVGGGFSYGFADFGGGRRGIDYDEGSWHGSGLQLEVTVGYEGPRSSPMRMFVEANATLPFYNVASEHTTYSKSFPYSTSVSSHRYAPAVMVSVGLGWDWHRLP